MLPTDHKPQYHSYLLRLWRAADAAPWQGSLQSTATGETRRFTEMDSLWAFLLGVMDKGEEPKPTEEDRT